jgi:hypothetical protein
MPRSSLSDVAVAPLPLDGLKGGFKASNHYSFMFRDRCGGEAILAEIPMQCFLSGCDCQMYRGSPLMADIAKHAIADHSGLYQVYRSRTAKADKMPRSPLPGGFCRSRQVRWDCE